MTLPRFYVPALGPGGRAAALPEDEANHLTRVMRLGAGDDIAVFDGRGREYRARVVSAARGRVQVEVVEPIAPACTASLSLKSTAARADRISGWQ